MKAHIPARSRLPHSAKQAILEYDNEQKAETFRRWLKLTCVVLHDRFGFGHSRCADFLGQINEYANEEMHDEIFWQHIDRVIRELKLDFPEENYETLEK